MKYCKCGRALEGFETSVCKFCMNTPYGKITMKKTNTLPPVEIYDILSEAEAKGIKLPKEIEEWWETETAINCKAGL